MQRTRKKIRQRQTMALMDPKSGQIVPVGTDLYRIKVKRRSLLDWFASLGDVTVTDDGRVIFPRWMLPAIQSLYTQKKKAKGKPAEQLHLWEES